MRPAAILALGAAAAAAGSTKRPVIAIYSAPSTSSVSACGGSCDYVAASYVKWVESAGGRAMPVPYDASDAAVDAAFGAANGLLFPGGGASLPPGAQRFFSKAIAANRAGDHFPVWGTCLGFEWLVELASGQGKAALDCGFDSENVSLALDLTDAAASSRLYADAPLRALLADAADPPTMNNHVCGITPEGFAANQNLTGFFTILSTNADRQGKRFVSTMEATEPTMPVWGVQWHPEKNNFEWNTNPDYPSLPYEAINHSPAAVRTSQAMVDFLVAEARKNGHGFANPSDEDAALFWNYNATRTQRDFEQTYYIHFPERLLRAEALRGSAAHWRRA